jgi:S1-C subfamily serine protease
MTRTLGVLIGVVLVLAIGYVAMMVAMPEARPSLPEVGKLVRPTGGHPGAAARSKDAKPFEELVVTVDIPPAAELPELRGCPAHQVCDILGIKFGAMHGMGVSAVSPEGPAAKAGIQPGDGIALCKGKPVTCPSTLLPGVRPGKTTKEVELTLRRVKKQESESPPNGTSAKDEQSEASAADEQTGD